MPGVSELEADVEPKPVVNRDGRWYVTCPGPGCKSLVPAPGHGRTAACACGQEVVGGKGVLAARARAAGEK